MKKTTKWLIPFCLIVALSVNAYAAVGGAAVLKKGVGARALGMGGAFTSISNDTSAIYWNPAGLGQVQDYSVTIMGSAGAPDEWPGQKDAIAAHNFIAVSLPISKFTDTLRSSVFAVGLINSSMDNVTKSDEEGNEYGSFSAPQNAVYFSWGMPVWESNTNLYVGLSFKYIMEKMEGIAGGSASGYDIDAGVLYNVFETFNFGLFIGKGAVMKWDGGTDNAALTAKFGVSNTFSLTEKLSILGSVDIIQRQKEPLLSNIGLEFACMNIYNTGDFGLSGLYLRGGIEGVALENRYGIKEEINKNITYAVGFGIDITVFGRYLQIDYAMGMGNSLDQQSKISLNFYF
ncbi:MAG: hypothetical protein LBD46_02580 [Endomicrobium sp.]|jgi:hypothetical protein|nr:hypothetical protein [Endomicrobium sp.]